jgi:hypothetical protein
MCARSDMQSVMLSNERTLSGWCIHILLLLLAIPQGPDTCVHSFCSVVLMLLVQSSTIGYACHNLACKLDRPSCEQATATSVGFPAAAVLHTCCCLLVDALAGALFTHLLCCVQLATHALRFAATSLCRHICGCTWRGWLLHRNNCGSWRSIHSSPYREGPAGLPLHRAYWTRAGPAASHL